MMLFRRFSRLKRTIHNFLKKRSSLVVEEACPTSCAYEEIKEISMSDEQFEEKLREFIHAVEFEESKRFELYSALKGGTERQLTRLGYALMTRRNLNDPKYMEFKYLISPTGVPYIPCCAKRGSWSCFIRVDLNAFSSEDTLIGFSTDIYDSFVDSSRLKPIGTAVYNSPAFGWLGETKEAMVFQIDRQHIPSREDMNRYVEAYCLTPEEHESNHAAFIVENGEKEYSVEITAISNGKVEVLYRYTIGGMDRIESSFEPSLVELVLQETAL